MGFTQKYGVDFTETFAGVVIGKSFRIMLVILNEGPQNEMEHWDIKQAFTQAELKEDLFMHQPEMFQKLGPNGKDMVCRLKKSIYGLKQSARNFEQLLRSLFADCSFTAFFSDPC